jgi:hypothetical protein
MSRAVLKIMKNPAKRFGKAFCAAAMLLAISWGADAQTTPAKTFTPARLADGQIDLQGTWTNQTLTPLQRPAALAGKEFFTPAEAAEFAHSSAEAGNSERLPDTGARGAADLARRAYNDAWMDRGTGVVKTLRTSLVVDPPDGHIPPFTPEAKKVFDATFKGFNDLGTDGPEDRLLTERCILFGGAGPPMLVEPYNSNYQIVQTPGYIAILSEMVHDVRVVPLDNRPRPPATVRQWQGVPRGHWEGDTLVVESTNFRTSKVSRFGVGYLNGMSDENLRVIERFKRMDADTILYRAAVEDPTVYTKPWTVELTLGKRNEPIYEYACHEGNYGMQGILAGARAQEKKGK